MSSTPIVAGRPRTSVLALLAILFTMLGVAGPGTSPASAEGRFIITTSTVGENPGVWSADGFRVGAGLANVGDEPVDVTSMTLSGPGSQYLRLDSGVDVPTTIDNGDFRSWNYRFLPPGRATLEATVTWQTSIGVKTATMRFGVTESDLAVAPIDFGDVNVGAEKRVDVAISNRGDGAARGVDLTARSPAVRFENVPRTIAAGATATAVAVARPTRFGDDSDSVTASASTQPGTAYAPFRLNGVGGRLELEPKALTTVALTGSQTGTSAATEVVVRNTGNRTVQIEDVRVAVAEGDGTAALEPAVVGALEPGQTLSLGVRITGSRRGTVGARLFVESDAIDPSVATTVSAKFVAPVPTIRPDAYEFGDTGVGETKTGSFTVGNDGDADLLFRIPTQPTPAGPFSTSLTLGQDVRVAPGESVDVPVTFAPTASGFFSGQLPVLYTDELGRAAGRPVLFRGRSAAPVLTAENLDLGTLTVGDPEKTATLQFSNTGPGTSPLVVDDITVEAPFSLAPTVLPITAPQGATRSVQIRFTPVARGTFTGKVTFTSNASPATREILVTAKVVGPIAKIAPAVSFGDVLVGTPTEKTVDIENVGDADLHVGGISIASTPGVDGAADFDALPTGAPTIAPGATGRFTVRFTPTARGPRGATFSVGSDSVQPAGDVLVTGRGISATADLSATSAAFGDVRVGTTSTKTIAVTNNGNAPLTFGAVSTTGAAFGVTGSTADLAPGATRGFTVSFAPTARGAATGSLRIASSAAGSPATVALTGKGVAPVAQVAPAAVAFGTVTRGTSATQTVTVTNVGDAPLALGTVTVTGADAARFVVTGDASPIAPGASRALSITFTPNAAGARSASLAIASDATTAIPAIALSGTGTGTSWALAIDPAATTLFASVGTTLRPIAPATGTNPITFPINGGTVTAAGAGTLSSDGGLEFRRTLTSSAWNDVALDLTKKSVTARTGLLGLRSEVAVLTDVTTTPGLGDTLTIKATIKISGVGATLLNVLTLRPLSVFSGYKLGTVTITAPRT